MIVNLQEHRTRGYTLEILDVVIVEDIFEGEGKGEVPIKSQGNVGCKTLESFIQNTSLHTRRQIEN